MDNVEMHEIAVACSRLAEMVPHSVNDARIRDPDSRQQVAQALLAAAIDHAVSVTYLLSHPSPSVVFSAVGIFRMQSFGNAVEECQGGIRYIMGRYHTASLARAFWEKHHWY